MAKYVDGFVLAVSKKRLKEYEKMATKAGKVWKKHGALQYFECVGDDLTPNMGETPEMGKMLRFPETVKCKPDETVIFSFIIFKSRKHRDSVNKKVMKELSAEYDAEKDKDMPFDMQRMAYGGFTTLVESK